MLFKISQNFQENTWKIAGITCFLVTFLEFLRAICYGTPPHDCFCTGGNTCIVIMKKSDYRDKMEIIIDGGVIKGTHIETTNNMLKELFEYQDITNIEL